MNDNEIYNWIIKLIKHNNIKAFYNSGAWLHKRADALDRDNNECQNCKAKGLFSPANCVHHKKHVKKYPELALDLDNLISLCNSCHDVEHPEKFNNKPKPQLNQERW
jgi:5-methylcytosine-specific restriction enzyme A